MKTIAASLFASLLVTVSLTSGHAQGGNWNRHTIDPSDKSEGKLGADGVRLADANRDGLMDVVTGWENGDAIRVCINPGPEKAQQHWPGVTVGRVKGAEDAVFADVDGDGNLDVISCCEGKTRAILVHWAPKEKKAYLSSDQWKMERFPSADEADQAWMFCLPFDVNRDGAIDLIVGSKGKGASVSWLRNPGSDSARDLKSWKMTRICDAGWIMSIIETDLDGDGNRDIVFSDRKGNRSGVYWLKTSEEDPFFAPEILLGAGGEEVLFIDVVDINQDGRLDIAAAIRKSTIGFLYQPESEAAKGNWKREDQTSGVPQDRFGGSKAVRVADMNQDGKMEIVVTCEGAKGKLSGTFMVHHHTGSLAGELLYQNIAGAEGVKFDRMELIDLDADGDLDIMTCEEISGLGVFWYENPAK